MPRTTILHAVQACYRLNLSDREWLEGLTVAMAPFVDHGRGVGAWSFRPGQWTSKELPIGVDPEVGESMWATATGFTAEELRTVFLGARVTSATARLGMSVGLDEHAGVRRFVEPLRIKDFHAISVVDADGSGVALAGASEEVVRLEPKAQERLERLASHVLAGLRLRSALAAVDAVLTPDGKTVHAEGEARAGTARDALRAAVVAFDGAHARRGTRDPDAAVEAWAALVAGRWSIVERFDTDGRRYLVARRNEPHRIPATALTPLESHALLLRAQGLTYKAIRYELGLSEAAVYRRVRSGLKKLGLASDMELSLFFGAHAQALLRSMTAETPTRGRSGASVSEA